MGFARNFRRRNKAQLGPVGVPASDHDMLRAAKWFLDGETNVFKSAEDKIVVVVDLRDSFGALWASIWLGLVGVGGGDDELDREIIRDFVGKVLNYGGTLNPCPFVVFWTARTAFLLDWLRSKGFDVPPDWYPTIDAAPQPGNVYTILKRNGAGVLLSVDYTGIEPLEVPMVEMSGDACWTAPTRQLATGVSDEARKDRVHMFEYNQELAENAAVAAVANGTGVEEVVVFLIDTLDPIGRQMARAMDFTTLETKIASGHYPTVTAYLPRDVAREILALTHPRIAETLESAPKAGCFWTVCIGSGGGSLLQHEFRIGAAGLA